MFLISFNENDVLIVYILFMWSLTKNLKPNENYDEYVNDGLLTVINYVFRIVCRHMYSPK